MGDIKLIGVSKAFGGEEIFRGLNLSFRQGEVTAVMGPSGLGKTTLLRILLGLEDFEGRLEGMEGLRAGVIFQENRLMPWLSVRQNIELISPKASRNADRALALMELSESADKKPGELSGGMQRRAALARAVAAGGDVLILDEPFTGLDEDLKDRIAGKLYKNWKNLGKTVIFVTHDSGEAGKYADRVIKLGEVK